MEKLRMIIIGAGNRSRIWRHGFEQYHNFEVVALADPSEENMAKTAEIYGIPPERRFTDVDEALDTVEADCALVASTNLAHAQNCHQALDRGLHVACEKPLVEDLSRAKGIMEKAREKGLIVSVTQSARHSRLTEVVADLLRERAIGDVGHMVETYYRNRMRPDMSERAIKQEWPELHQIAVHDFDRFRFWFDSDVNTVRCEGLSPSWSPYENPAVTLAWLEMDNGVRIQYFASFVSKISSSRQHFAIEGSTGQLYFDSHRRSLFLSRPEVEEDEDVLASIPDPEIWPDTKFLKCFYESIVKGAEVFCPPEDNVKTLATVRAAIVSAESGGEKVKVQQVLDDALKS